MADAGRINALSGQNRMGEVGLQVRHVMRLLMMLSAVAAPAAAQIDSHSVPQEWPTQLFPNYVTRLPEVESQDIAAPLLSDAVRSRKAKAAGGQNRPDATNLAEMCADPLEAIRLAESGRFLEAARAGDAILETPRERFRDFTWDYLANATAWSFLQCGDLLGATRAHTSAAARIDDPAISEFHSRIARMLSSPGRVAGPLKDYAAYKAEVQKVLNERIEALKKAAQPGQKILLEDVRLARLYDAYAILRVIAAFDQGAAKEEARNTYQPAAKCLANDILTVQLEEGRNIQKALEERVKTAVRAEDFDKWNATIGALWMKVRKVKRLCRMHDYLVRMDLAKAAGADRTFGEAHRLLFVPNDAGKVWQDMGRTIVVNNTAQLDIRLRVPYQETRITPMGVPFAGKLAAPVNAWNPADTRLNPATGRMHEMQPATRR
jgi:hypothetical protein